VYAAIAGEEGMNPASQGGRKSSQNKARRAALPQLWHILKLVHLPGPAQLK